MSDQPASEFGRLDHRAPLAQPSVNRVGPGWNDPAMRVERGEPHSHAALSVLAPGELPPAPEPPPKPTPPVLSETERREKLVQAITAKETADEALQVAVERHGRAQAEETRCRLALADYAALPAEIARHKELALRTGVEPGLPASMRARLQGRATAEADLEAARQAVPVFAEERRLAQQAYGRASWQVTAALRSVLDVERDRLRADLHVIEQHAEAYRQVLRHGNLAAPWDAVTAGLLADPMAAPIAVEVPEAPLPEPPPVPLVASPPPALVALARPVGDPGPVEIVSEAEIAARARTARASTSSSAMREADAIEWSRRGATQ